jgi:MATE family multidrug resistance protein
MKSFAKSFRRTIQQPNQSTIEVPLATITSISSNSYAQVFKSLTLNSIPTIIYMGSTLAMLSISLHFVGGLGDNEEEQASMLDAVGVALTLLNATSMGFVMSLNNGLISVGSQAYGSRNYRLLGIYFHRAIFLNIIVWAISCGFLCTSYYIFLGMQMSPGNAHIASEMTIYTFGALLAFAMYDTLKAFLMAQDIFLPQLVVQVMISCGHWFWCWFFIVHMGMDANGVAMALTVTFFTGLVLLYLYMFIFKPCPDTFFRFKRDSFKGICSLFMLELPVGAAVYLDYIMMEITIFFAAPYQAYQTSALVAFFNVLSIIDTIPLGLATTLNSLAGMAMGERDIEKTKKLFVASMVLLIIIMIMAAVPLYFARSYIIEFFTNSAQIETLTDDIVVIYLFILPADFCQCIWGGYIRGIGKEKAGSICFGICYYIIALPLAFVLGNVVGENVRGIWYGIGTGIYGMFLCCIIIISTSNLKEQGGMIASRIRHDKNALSVLTGVRSIQETLAGMMPPNGTNQYKAPHPDEVVITEDPMEPYSP